MKTSYPASAPWHSGYPVRAALLAESCDGYDEDMIAEVECLEAFCDDDGGVVVLAGEARQAVQAATAE